MKESQMMSMNPLVNYFKKSPKDFTKADLIKFVEEKEIKMINFHYVAGDGRLKTLGFILNDREYLEQILSNGERVDGSNIFPAFIHAGSSDLYVIPRFSTAFINPFAEIPTLSFLCSYYNKDGQPLENSPEYILRKACKSFTEVTGMYFQAMGELEYYVIGEAEELYTIPDQRGYHETSPFSKFESFRAECMYNIAKAGGQIKYGHSEVGNFTMDGKIYEQNEIEFLVADAQQAADQLVLAKWIIRNLAYQYGLDVTFSPKITTGKAGSGLHIHTRIVNADGKNQYVTKGKLNSIAKTAIAGYMTCAGSLTAFGNTNPTSYFRLVPHQEAPTSICWGDRNRSVLVRVPLGWTHKNDIVADLNPLEKPVNKDRSQKQTVEFRCPDGSADIYLLIAGLAVAARHGFEMEGALDFAKKTYVDVDIHKAENKDLIEKLAQLPSSCWESADELSRHRDIFEKYGVFNAEMIDDIVKQLKSFKDQKIRKEIEKNPEIMTNLVHEYFYCG
ncbi:MAG: glutamine synthetase family protein [Bacteroidales bacterium]|nr:glutamine synthetase family protein [Bacteroidales bacterium]